MSQQGPFAPSSVTEHPNLGLVTNLSGIVILDNNPLKWPTGVYESKVVVKGFGFSVPNDATVQGIEISSVVTRAIIPVLHAEPANYLRAALTLDGLNATGDWKNIPYKTVQFTEQGPIGASDDHWGSGLAPSQVNDDNFGFVLMVTDDQLHPEVPTDNDEMQIDYFAVSVYYSEAGGGGSVTSSVLDAANMRYLASGLRTLETNTRRA